MARVDSEFPLSGRDGDFVYYNRNGHTYRRKYVEPNDPKTLNQLKNRAKLRVAGNFLKEFKLVLRRGYQAPLKYVVPFMEAQKFLIDNCLTIVDPPVNGEKFQFEVNIPSFKLSRGRITPPDVTSIERSDNALSLSWVKNLLADANRLYDSMNLVAFTPGKKAVWLTGFGTREQGEGKTLLPKDMDKPVHLWVFFSNEQKTTKVSQDNVSDSVYLGIF